MITSFCCCFPYGDGDGFFCGDVMVDETSPPFCVLDEIITVLCYVAVFTHFLFVIFCFSFVIFCFMLFFVVFFLFLFFSCNVIVIDNDNTITYNNNIYLSEKFIRFQTTN